MAGRVEDEVAFITGAARGQGRRHALTRAREGVDTAAPRGTGPIAVDIATKADVRDLAALKDALGKGVAELGHSGIVSANAGVFQVGDTTEDVSEEDRDTVDDLDVKGVRRTAKAAIPFLKERGTGVEPGDISNAVLFLASDE